MATSQLSFDLVPEGGRSNFHLPNPNDDDFRRVWAQTTNGSSPLSVTVKLAELHHGKMNHENRQCDASLLLLEIRFQSSLRERRYKSASITVEFFDEASNDRRDPHVVKVAPDRKHWLNKTAYDKTTSRGVSAGAQGGVGAAGGNITAQWNVEYTKPEKFKATLTGRPHHSKGRRAYINENAVTWTMQENTDESEGIPSFLQAAVLLRHQNASFFARLRVNSEVDFATRLRRALPFTTDQDKIIDPVVFRPGREQVQNSCITGITDHDLKHMHMLPMSNYFKVSLSEEDDLTPQAGSQGPDVDLGSQPTSAAIVSESDLATRPPITLNRSGGSVPSVISVVVAAANKAAVAAQAAARAAASAAEVARIAQAAAESAALAAAEAATTAAEVEVSKRGTNQAVGVIQVSPKFEHLA